VGEGGDLSGQGKYDHERQKERTSERAMMVALTGLRGGGPGRELRRIGSYLPSRKTGRSSSRGGGKEKRTALVKGFLEVRRGTECLCKGFAGAFSRELPAWRRLEAIRRGKDAR